MSIEFHCSLFNDKSGWDHYFNLGLLPAFASPPPKRGSLNIVYFIIIIIKMASRSWEGKVVMVVTATTGVLQIHPQQGSD